MIGLDKAEREHYYDQTGDRKQRRSTEVVGPWGWRDGRGGRASRLLWTSTKGRKRNRQASQKKTSKGKRRIGVLIESLDHKRAYLPPPAPHLSTLHPFRRTSPHILLPSPAAGFLSPTSSRGIVSEYDAAYARFLNDYPQYASSWHVDALRRSEYSRLGPDETYVDYMGGAIYPTSLISVHAEFLQGAVLGNTHSESPSSKLSAALAATARAAVLSFFNAPSGSTVVFTANASAALKLVGEAFPFIPGSAFLLPEDAHNSVHGIREFARSKGAPIVYLPSPPRGGVQVREAFALIDEHRPSPGTPALFAYTGQSNITNSKPPLAVLAHASMRGFTTLLDAAALAPTTPIDLTNTPVDAVAVSGHLSSHQGVGAWLREKRPWSRGSPSVRTAAIDEAFEDGTLNYTLLPAVTTGLRLLGAYLPALPTRIAALSASCARTLEDIRWPRSGSPAEMGDPVPLSRVAAHAAANGIALRTGCMCNPGGAAAMLSLGSLMSALEEAAGRELGVVRISFGLASCWADVWQVRCWILRALKDEWVIHSSGVGHSVVGIIGDKVGSESAVGTAF
ncbi:PLP-dependent transferase [Lactarius indigo]|nr:PLP-dependent transferase [Lactarius indigo]